MSESQRQRRTPKPAPNPGLTPDDPLSAFSTRLGNVRNLDDLARRYPGRDIAVGRERKQLEFYSGRERPNAFAMDSLEFFFVVTQYYREALPLRMLLLLISCQRAGGEISLTQEDMATVLDVTRQKANGALQDLMGHGIVWKVKRGVYQLNPPFSYCGAEAVRSEDGRIEYVSVDQREVLDQLRKSSLPDHVRYPSLEHMRRAIDEMRAERAELRKERRRLRQTPGEIDEEATGQ